jgi:hypothetical protein
MSKTEEQEELNKSQNKEVQLPCIQCTGKTSHKILVSVDKSGEWVYRWGDSIQWFDIYQIVQCNGCKTNSFRSVNGNSEDYHQISEDEWETGEIEKLYPSRIEGRKTLENTNYYLPNKVESIYKETIQALSGNSPILAGIGLRALIETICKEKNAQGGNLLARIDSLVDKNILTPEGSKILHKIRTLGNDATHEVKPHNEKQLNLAMEIMEHLLTDVYILPKKVDTEFND